ncbi:MAG: site-specific integrase [Mesorhizobium sp.]|uniref:tyrosine-type recombinase/integrase n=1 Tax=Mesorhizobium sp. TaxID=1871066 RepID=UPI0012022DC5|nr:site-specific integrase [Mesorhizobium sp.]TIL91715.1 MAG: site-specific integrase [Mesorhizobium sp.]TIM00636.1 MAG: site-specific integrase [Mesorhizobium sp.]
MTNSIPYLRKTRTGTFYVHWTESRVGKRVSTRTKDPTSATAFFAAWLLRGQTPLAPTLADVWTAYVEKHVRPETASAELIELAWKNLGKHFGKLSSSSLSQSAVDEYIERRTSGRLGRKVKPQTAGKEVSYLVAAVRFCASARRGLLPASYVRKISLPPPGAPSEKWFRPAEIEKLFAAALRLRLARGGAYAQRLSRVERFMWLALETAARREALLQLSWSRVDFEFGVIDLNVPGRPQTKKRRAVVPISDSLRPILERAYAERLHKDRDGLVLDNAGAIWPQFQRVAIEAGMSRQRKPKAGAKPKSTGFSPHVLRHTAASMMARNGAPLWKIGKVLGDKISTVEKFYAKHQPDDLRDVVNLISGKPK